MLRALNFAKRSVIEIMAVVEFCVLICNVIFMPVLVLPGFIASTIACYGMITGIVLGYKPKPLITAQLTLYCLCLTVFMQCNNLVQNTGRFFIFICASFVLQVKFLCSNSG